MIKQLILRIKNRMFNLLTLDITIDQPFCHCQFIEWEWGVYESQLYVKCKNCNASIMSCKPFKANLHFKKPYKNGFNRPNNIFTLVKKEGD